MTASSFNLLAFGFASPTLLGWLVLAAVPFLIHWLFRRRYREVTWAAMQFLYEAARKQSRRTRLEQLLLLAARVLILTLIVLAFAQPHWTDAGKLAQDIPPTLRVIVLDASLSLGRKPTDASKGSTLFEAGKGIAREIVRKSRAGDRFMLARIGGTEPRLLIRQPTLFSSAVLEEIDRLPLTFERGDVAATLRQLPEVMAAKLPQERCEVVVISDFQADNWNVGQVSNLPELLKPKEGSFHELVLIDVGPAQPDNAAVVGLTSDPPLLAAEQPMSVTATLRNAGTSPLTARRVELRIDEQLADSRRVDLPLSQDVTVEFTLAAPPAGEHSLSVRLEDDSLPADNERWLPLTVRSELSVLLVNGRPGGRPRDAATFFVEQALSPKSARPTEASRWLRVTTVPDFELPNVDFDRHDVVFLCDVHTVAELDAERLRRFATNGGGVLLTLGPTSSIEQLNTNVLGPHGLLSIRLMEPVTATTNLDGTLAMFGFDPGNFTHPLLHEFRGNPGAGLETALIRQYVRADLTDESGVETRPADARRAGPDIALRFSNGDPAIFTQPLGRGRCILLTTSLDETWGEWAIWAPGFVPLIHELVEYAAAGRSRPHDVLVGEPIEHEVASDTASVTLKTPDNIERTLTPLEDRPSPEETGTSNLAAKDRHVPFDHGKHPGQSRIVFQDTLRPGIYTLESGSRPLTSERVAVNVDPRESDPRRLAPRELVTIPEGSADNHVVVREADAPIPAEPTKEISELDSLSLHLLAVVLGLLLVEQALAWRFTAGVYVAILSLAVAAVWLAVRFL